MKRSTSLLLTTFSAVAFLACDGPDGRAQQDEYRPIVAFDTALVRIVTASDTFVLTVEVAEREDQRMFGLMERPSLPEDEGMIFLHSSEQPADVGFWMYRTRIPLDIAYFGADGEIRSIRSMEPCPHPHPGGCPGYPAGVTYFGALEVNRGYFARRGIDVGDRIILERRGAAAAR